jgi:predicted RNA binding protein YcfA (HicA-like mRNA interferase family)
MLKHEGFAMKSTGGSHHIFTRADVPDIINLQPGKDGKAKPYQVKQVAALLQTYPKK